jgi:hypothetical protein
MANDNEEICYTCDSCGEETDDPVSVHVPVKGGMKSPLDFCPGCAKEEMQRMIDRLGHEHGASMVLEVKSRQAKRGPQGIAAKARPREEEESS